MINGKSYGLSLAALLCCLALICQQVGGAIPGLPGTHNLLFHGGSTQNTREKNYQLTQREREALYEGYNLLHTLAQDFHKPFDSPAVIVVGHQTSGKSALIEALMGFQFNQVSYQPIVTLPLSQSKAILTYSFFSQFRLEVAPRLVAR